MKDHIWLCKIDQEVIFDGDWFIIDENFDALIFCRIVNYTWTDQLIVNSNFFHEIIFQEWPILVDNKFIKLIISDGVTFVPELCI